jgi:hypothetical protein
MGNTFLSYVDNRGFIPLNLTNEFSTFGSAAAGDNVRESLGADLTGIAGTTVNSLILNNTAFAGLDFHDDVASVVGVARDEQPTQALLSSRDGVFHCDDFSRERLVLFRQLFRRDEIFLQFLQALKRCLDLTQFGVTTVELFRARGIRVHSRVGKLNLKLLVLGQQGCYRIKHLVLLSGDAANVLCLADGQQELDVR